MSYALATHRNKYYFDKGHSPVVKLLSITQLPKTVFAAMEHEGEYHRNTSYQSRRQRDYFYCQGQE